MRLRDKNTGETGYLELEKGDDEKYIGIRVYKNDFLYKRYQSLAELNEEWEDYKPKEPLIKDEKIRKAVRAWAEANGIEDVGVVQHREITTICDKHIDITFYGSFVDVIDGADYTITELCGESGKEYSALKAKVLGTNYELEEE